MIRIAIDGPGGAGKSTVAKEVAKKLGIIYVDTGALYRTIGLYMLNNGIDPKDKETVAENLHNFSLELKFVDGKQVILLDGEDVGDKIRTPEASMAASDVSAIKEVREYLFETQRNIAKTNSVIMDGRDIGTVILPDAEVKIFRTASSEARAKRRYNELLKRGQNVMYEQVYSEMVERDKNDSTRAIAPCVQAKDAILIDNSKLDFDGTVKKVLKVIKKYKPKKNFYARVQRFYSPLLRSLLKIEVKGIENVPMTGPIMVCPNHIAAHDPIVIGYTCPRQLTFLAKKELLKVPVLGRLVRKLGAITIDRASSDVSAIRATVNVLKKDGALAVFPQGHRFPGVDLDLAQAKNGVGMIAYRSKCTVVPVFINTKGFKYHLFGKVQIIYGKPIPYEEFDFSAGGNEAYIAATKKIMGEIIALKDAALNSDGDKK